MVNDDEGSVGQVKNKVKTTRKTKKNTNKTQQSKTWLLMREPHQEKNPSILYEFWK